MPSRPSGLTPVVTGHCDAAGRHSHPRGYVQRVSQGPRALPGSETPVMGSPGPLETIPVAEATSPV